MKKVAATTPKFSRYRRSRRRTAAPETPAEAGVADQNFCAPSKTVAWVFSGGSGTYASVFGWVNRSSDGQQSWILVRHEIHMYITSRADMSASGSDIGQLGYGSFYVPSVAFGYFAATPGNAILQRTPEIHLSNHVLTPQGVLLLVTSITFIGAMQQHGIGRAIFGRDGPGERPKQTAVAYRHTLAIILGVEAEKIPIPPCRFLAGSPTTAVSSWFLFRGPGKDYVEMRNSGIEVLAYRAENTFHDLMELNSLIGRKQLFRLLYFFPVLVHQVSAYLALILLGFSVYVGSVTYASLILLFGLFALLLRRKVWFLIPDPQRPDAMKDRFKPEYRLGEDSQLSDRIGQAEIRSNHRELDD